MREVLTKALPPLIIGLGVGQLLGMLLSLTSPTVQSYGMIAFAIAGLTWAVLQLRESRREQKECDQLLHEFHQAINEDNPFINEPNSYWDGATSQDLHRWLNEAATSVHLAEPPQIYLIMAGSLKEGERFRHVNGWNFKEAKQITQVSDVRGLNSASVKRLLKVSGWENNPLAQHPWLLADFVGLSDECVFASDERYVDSDREAKRLFFHEIGPTIYLESLIHEASVLAATNPNRNDCDRRADFEKLSELADLLARQTHDANVQRFGKTLHASMWQSGMMTSNEFAAIRKAHGISVSSDASG